MLDHLVEEIKLQMLNHLKILTKFNNLDYIVVGKRL